MTSGTPPPWSYTRNQRLGLLLLLLIIGGAYGIRTAILSSRPSEDYDDDRLVAAADRLRLPSPDTTQTDRGELASFEFDPNTVSEARLVRLGLSKKQAASFIKYRDRRSFQTAEEIRNLYVLRSDQADHLIALAKIPAKLTQADRTASSPAKKPQTFAFDPNTISPDSFQLLGFSRREANILAKYRGDRQSTFREPEDLLRVTAIDSLRVKALLPVMAISALPDLPAPASPPLNDVAVPLASLDVNTASVEEWQKLPGIGPFRAAQIVKFRNLLGGFTRADQVSDTYGLPDSSYRIIRPYLTASVVTPSLFVNRMDPEALARHPYLDRRTAAIIVRYRENHGPFAGADDLRKVRALTTETLEALLPYLNFAP